MQRHPGVGTNVHRLRARLVDHVAHILFVILRVRALPAPRDPAEVRDSRGVLHVITLSSVAQVEHGSLQWNMTHSNPAATKY